MNTTSLLIILWLLSGLAGVILFRHVWYYLFEDYEGVEWASWRTFMSILAGPHMLMIAIFSYIKRII